MADEDGEYWVWNKNHLRFQRTVLQNTFKPWIINRNTASWCTSVLKDTPCNKLLLKKWSPGWAGWLVDTKPPKKKERKKDWNTLHLSWVCHVHTWVACWLKNKCGKLVLSSFILFSTAAFTIVASPGTYVLRQTGAQELRYHNTLFMNLLLSGCKQQK
jgi:hypothetical protein